MVPTKVAYKGRNRKVEMQEGSEEQANPGRGDRGLLAHGVRLTQGGEV